MYQPDVWQLVKIQLNDGSPVMYKVLAGWYGGYGGSDAWKLSSACLRADLEMETGCIVFHNESGSQYRGTPHGRRFSGLTGNIYQHLVKDIRDAELGTVTLVESAIAALPALIRPKA